MKDVEMAVTDIVAKPLVPLIRKNAQFSQSWRPSSRTNNR